MKKSIIMLIILFVISVCSAVLADVPIDEAHFPDENFRQFLLEIDYNHDGVFDSTEVKDKRFISLGSRNISDLTGIEYFTEMEELLCESNQLTKLNLKKNTKLTMLQCDNNHLTQLDLTNNKALKTLFCQNNALTKLDLTKNTKLLKIWCSNNKLVQLDVKKCALLAELSCSDNQLTSLNVSKNTKLTILRCSRNQLTKLNVNGSALTQLECQHNQLSKLDISKCPALCNMVKEGEPQDSITFYYWSLFYDYTLMVDKSVQIITDSGVYPVELKTVLVTSIKLNKIKETLKIGGALKLSVTSIQPSDATNKNVIWVSTDSKVASVDKSGNVSAKAKGTTYIVCIAADESGVCACCKVTVK